MIFPFKHFIEYLIAVGFKDDFQIKDFIKRGDFIVPTSKEIRNIKSAFIQRIISHTGKKAVKHKKRLAKRWLKKFKFDRLIEKNLERLVDILNAPDIKRIIEVLLITEVPAIIISEIILDKFRQRFSSRIIKLYEYFFWNFGSMKHDERVEYVYHMRGIERDIRYEAIFHSENYARNKLNVGANITPVFATRTVLEYSFFDYIEFAQTHPNSPLLSEKAKAVLISARLLYMMTTPAGEKEPGLPSERDIFLKTLELRKKEFVFPTLESISKNARVEDAKFIPKPTKAIEHKKAEKIDILEIPVPQKKKKITVKEIIEGPPPEEFDGED